MRKRHDGTRERTRAVLARIVLWLVAVLAVGVLVATALQHQLGLSRESVHLLWRVFVSVLGLGFVVLAFYFPRRA